MDDLIKDAIEAGRSLAMARFTSRILTMWEMSRTGMETDLRRAVGWTIDGPEADLYGVVTRYASPEQAPVLHERLMAECVTPARELVTERTAEARPGFTMDLTEFRTAEVMNGLDIDRDDGNPEWGRLEPRGKGKRGSRTSRLVILPGQLAYDRALYRLTSVRDIWQDNASGGDLAYDAGARSMTALVTQFMELAGGKDAFSAEFHRWITN